MITSNNSTIGEVATSRRVPLGLIAAGALLLATAHKPLQEIAEIFGVGDDDEDDASPLAGLVSPGGLPIQGTIFA